MPSANKRQPTKYPGIYYRTAVRLGGKGDEKVFYAVYKKDGKMIEAKVGREFADGMTAAKANRIRAEFIEGKAQTPQEKRQAERNKPKKLTLKVLWDAYSAKLENERTRRTDASNFRHLAELAERDPESLTKKDVDAVKLALEDAGKSPQTQKHVLILLKRILLFGAKRNGSRAKKKGISWDGTPITLHPELEFVMPEVNNEKTEFLDPEQLKALLIALDTDPDQNLAAMMKLALFTGMRRSALLSLQWNDVDERNGFITLRAEYAKNNKTAILPLSKKALEVIGGVERTSSPFLFPGRNGKKRTEIRAFLDRIKVAARLPADFRPLHGLRHTFASLLASSQQVGMLTLQELLTHSSPEMTKRYSHLTETAKKAALDLLSKSVDEAMR